MHVVSLADGRPCVPTPPLAGPWRSIRLLRLGAGEAEELPAGDIEYAAYVLDGAGTARVGADAHALRRGTGLVLLRGAGAALEAGPAGLVVFVEALDAPPR